MNSDNTDETSRTGYFKFLHNEHIDYVLRDGTILVSTRRHFQLIEGPDWIVDPAEGVRIDYVGSNTIGRETPNSLLYCLSHGPLDAVTTAMCLKPQPELRYDSCVEVLDIGAFERLIVEDGTVVELQKKVSELFKVEKGDVSYDKVPIDYGEEYLTKALPPASLFEKAPLFKPQSEFRFVFHPKTEIKERQLRIQFPDPANSLRCVFREREVGRRKQIAADGLDLVKPLREVAAKMGGGFRTERGLAEELGVEWRRLFRRAYTLGYHLDVEPNNPRIGRPLGRSLEVTASLDHMSAQFEDVPHKLLALADKIEATARD